MRKRKDESPLRPNPSFDPGLSPEVRTTNGGRLSRPRLYSRQGGVLYILSAALVLP